MGYTEGFPIVPFYWSSVTGFVTLQTINNRGSGYAFAINNAGQIAGASTVKTLSDDHAVLWNDSLSAPQDLGTLPGGEYAFAEGINNLGQVAGWSHLASH